jgi:hypothetical protein
MVQGVFVSNRQGIFEQYGDWDLTRPFAFDSLAAFEVFLAGFNVYTQAKNGSGILFYAKNE